MLTERTLHPEVGEQDADLWLGDDPCGLEHTAHHVLSVGLELKDPVHSGHRYVIHVDLQRLNSSKNKANAIQSSESKAKCNPDAIHTSENKAKYKTKKTLQQDFEALPRKLAALFLLRCKAARILLVFNSVSHLSSDVAQEIRSNIRHSSTNLM